MKLAIQINGHPASSMSANTAYQFIKAALRKNHQVIQVFFYYDGVFGGLFPPRSRSEPHELLDAPDWAELVSEYGLDLVICSAAADRRGLTARALEASVERRLTTERFGAFRLGGLGQWVDACLRCERFVTFTS